MSEINSSTVRLAIIGTGTMAGWHARHFKDTPGCEITACVDTNADRLKAFCEKYEVPAGYTSVSELLEKEPIDAVAVVTPDGSHKPISLECIAAGKHVLCEKPLALNYGDAKEMADAAEAAGVVNMVHFTYRNWAPLQAIAQHVKSGDLGDIRHVEASYHQAWLVNKQWGDWRTTETSLWRLSSAHGSKGVLGDVGVHILDFATFPCGPIKDLYCKLKTFDKAPDNRIGDYVLDANDTAVMTVEFESGAVGSIQTTRFMTGHTNRLFLKIAGTKGSVSFDSVESETDYKICVGDDIETDTWQSRSTESVPNLNERFVENVRTGTRGGPNFAHGAAIQKLLDAGFESEARQAPITINNFEGS